MNPLTLPRESDEGVRLGGHATADRTTETPGLIQRFSHLVLGVADLDRSEAWFRDVIGLDLLGRGLTAEQRPHTLLEMNTGQLLILVEVPEEEIRNGTGGVHHAFMLTPNQYRRSYDRLRAAGYEIGDDREQYRAVGEFSMDVQDPDGHRFQIQCYGLEARDTIAGVGVVDCGPAADYRVGAVKAFKTGNFYLLHKDEGFVALSRWCRPLNGLVVYQPQHFHFVCPFHGATYDRHGVNDPFFGNHAEDPLRLHPVSFGPDGHVLVDTDELIDRVAYDPSQAVQPAAQPAAAIRA